VQDFLWRSWCQQMLPWNEGRSFVKG
jgi:hypothetical protein